MLQFLAPHQSPFGRVFGYLMLSLAVILVTACDVPSPASPFTHDGVSFTVPAGWSIDDDAEFTEGYCYMAVSKEGTNSSGLMTITWFPNGDEGSVLGSAEEAVRQQIQTFKEDPNYKQMRTEGIRKYKFGDYEATVERYTNSIMGIAHSGMVIHLESKSKTFIIVKQEAVEDTKVNKPGFMELERTFRIEP